MRKSSNSEMTVTERAAFLGWRLMVGDTWTTAEVAAFFNIDRTTAYRRLCDISRILPIYQDGANEWKRVRDSD